MNKFTYFWLIIIALVINGCSSKGGEQEQVKVPVVTPVITGAQPGSGNDIYAGDATNTNVVTGTPAEQVVYFDFDRYYIRSDARPVVEAHAVFLANNPQIPVRLEGHADERGSREYNLALGEKRANAVRDALILLGVNPQQLTILSYGEERPIDSSHNEIAWQLNRRVEFVY